MNNRILVQSKTHTNVTSESLNNVTSSIHILGVVSADLKIVHVKEMAHFSSPSIEPTLARLSMLVAGTRVRENMTGNNESLSKITCLKGTSPVVITPPAWGRFIWVHQDGISYLINPCVTASIFYSSNILVTHNFGTLS